MRGLSEPLAAKIVVWRPSLVTTEIAKIEAKNNDNNYDNYFESLEAADWKALSIRQLTN
jgi:hypothetical protein